MCLQQPAAVCTDITNKAESIPPKGCFFPLFSFISATGLSQYRKLSMDSALLDSRNLTRFLIWGFAVFCSGLEHSAYPCREWQSCLGERVGHRELGKTEFSHIFYLPCVQVEGQAAVEGFSPAPISELQYPTVLGLGLTSQSKQSCCSHQSRALNSWCLTHALLFSTFLWYPQLPESSDPHWISDVEK